jgi:hypothetical protein
MDIKEEAKTLIDAGDLHKAGLLLKLERIMVSGGHAFDESDDSYGRRLLAEVVGADVAGASLPREMDKPSEAAAAAAEEAPKEEED